MTVQSVSASLAELALAVSLYPRSREYNTHFHPQTGIAAPTD